MKGDFSRYTFNKKKHYNGVLMQQGRVLLDADWNEQQAINRYRTETQGMDVIGPCGAPRDNPGFKITSPGGDQLNIGKGHYYVDGILVENENPVVYDGQSDFPTPPGILNLLKRNKATVGLVYLDVWQRHITSLDNPYLREKALDGPDTTTRLKTIWQVKVLPLPSVKIDKPADLAERILKWQGLEANLIELRLKGELELIKKARSEQVKVEYEIMELAPTLLCGKEFEKWSEKTAPSTGKLNAHTIRSNKDEGPCLLPPLAGYKRLENQLYRVEIHTGGPRSRATFKWSRDNASVVTEIKKIDGKDITVSDVGKDEVLGFANDQWVEITDDKTELSGKPGQLIQIANVNSATKIIKLKESPAAIDTALHAKLRRWDHVDQSGASVTEDGIAMGAADAWLPLEDGIEVQFSDGNYKTGDYWLIPGRTATGEIEWPPYQVPNTDPIAQPPLGIKHHFCRLALFFTHSSKFYMFEDCRKLFPPVTELTSLFYVSGDGQEAMPGEELPQPLRVGVANGQWPVAGATVCFKIKKGGGQLIGLGPKNRVLTGADGIARCRWKLDNTTRSQQVEATLLGSGGKTLHIPIIFTANLSTADQVAYNPKDCEKLKGANNVQLALEKLSQLTAISYHAGDGQEAPPGQGLPQLLQVSVANKCGPVDGATVRFETQMGGQVSKILDQFPTTSNNTIDVKTKDGIAGCAWKLEDNLTKPSQQLKATLIPPGGDDSNIQFPNTIVFTANLSTEGGGGCALTVGDNGLFKTLNDAFDTLVQSRDICLCLLPESHVIEKDIEVEDKDSIKIIGCGADIRQTAERFSLSANNILLLDLNLNVTTNSGRVLLSGNQVTVERSTFIRTAGATGPPLVTVTAQGAVADLRWKDNRMAAWWRKKADRKASDYLMPAADVSISEVARKRLDMLMKINPYTDKTAYDETLELVAKDIKRLNDDSRGPWIRNRPTRNINALPINLKKNVSNFYSVLGNPDADLTAVRESISAAVEAFFEFGYTEALALGYGVGGWIEDNNVNGYLTLHYDPKFTPLAWQKATDETLAQRHAFLKRGREYIVVDHVNLTLRSNSLYAVRSNGYSIMRVIDTIMKTGDWGDHEMPEMGYEFLTVTGNVFKSNGSGFVSQSIIMNENTFANKANQNLGVAAFVLGYSGIFVGNAGANQNLGIETILRPGWVRDSANIVSIVQ